MIDSVYLSNKEFNELIYKHPLMVLYLTIDQFDFSHSCVSSSYT